MSQSSQDHTSGISGRYAFALFELIQEDYDLNELDKINDELSTIGSAISQSEEMSKIIQSPIYNAQEQFSAMKSVLEILNTSEILTNFVGVLCQNRRLFVLPDMILPIFVILTLMQQIYCHFQLLLIITMLFFFVSALFLLHYQ